MKKPDAANIKVDSIHKLQGVVLPPCLAEIEMGIDKYSNLATCCPKANT